MARFRQHEIAEVINFPKYVGKISKHVREIVFSKDNYECLACGNPNDLTIDHIRPKSKGGNDKERNLQTLCAKCNVAKGNRFINYRLPIIYISGNVMGLQKEIYINNFYIRQLALENMGYLVINPVNRIIDYNLEDESWELLMKYRIGWLTECEEIHLGHDWQNSRDAILEYDIAQVLKIKIVYP